MQAPSSKLGASLTVHLAEQAFSRNVERTSAYLTCCASLYDYIHASSLSQLEPTIREICPMRCHPSQV